MKNISKLISLTLALFMLLPMAMSAAGNPDSVPGALQYADTAFYVEGYNNYYAITPGNSAANGGFGTTNPLGTALIGASEWSKPKTLPLFELLAYDRTSGAFNPGKLVSLTADGMKYAFPDGGNGFSYSTSGDTKQGVNEAFYAAPSESYTPVVSFTAPIDGIFEWRMSFQRKNNVLSGNANRPFTDLTGIQLKFYKNNSLIRRETVNDNALRTYTVQARLSKGDTIYLEFDPMHGNIKSDEFFVRELKVCCISHYDGVIDREYDNSNETPLLSLALLSDIHSDMDQMLNDVPTYGTYVNALEMIKERGDVDAILLGGDTLSDNFFHSNNPQFKNSYWTNENIMHATSFIFDEAKKATQDGNGLVIGVAGNHDKDPGVVAAHDKTTNKCGTIEEIFSGDYYSYFSKDSMTGAAIKTLRFNDMGPGFNSPYNEVVCYRYNVGGLEIIGISQSRSTIQDVKYPSQGCSENGIDDYDGWSNGEHKNSERIWKEQAEWVANELDEIGKNKTVIVLCHYNMSAWAMTVGGAAPVLLEAFEKHPNVIYTYGHCHGASDRSETWYNTIEHVETLGNRVQLTDGSYATDSWQYVYVGGIRYGTWKTSGNQDSAVSQFLTIDVYNDHITFRANNAGTESTVPGVWTPSSYTIKREMSQIDGYTGDGSGNVEVPDTTVNTKAAAHIPTSVTNVKKQFVMDLALNKLSNGQFSLKGILELTNAKLPLSKKAAETSWSKDYFQHNFNGYPLIQTAQAGGRFDMRADVGYSSAMIFTAPATGAYKYEIDMKKVSGDGGQCEVKVMKGGGLNLMSYTPEAKSNAPIVLSGYIYLEEGEELRVIVAKSCRSDMVGGNEIAVNNFVVKQYDSYTMPEAESEGTGDTEVGVCLHKGGTANCCERAKCEECGEEYGSLNLNKHASDEIISTITDSTHKAIYACCGKIKIAEGKHAFANGKCRVCEYECDHDGYVKDGKCENCALTDIPEEKGSEGKNGLPEYVIYIIIAVISLAVGVGASLLIVKRQKK